MGLTALCALSVLSCGVSRSLTGWAGVCRGYVGELVGAVSVAPSLPYHPAEGDGEQPRLHLLETLGATKHELRISYTDLTPAGPFLGLTFHPGNIFIEVRLGSTARYEVLTHEVGHTTQPPANLYTHPYANEWWAEVFGVVVQKQMGYGGGLQRSAVWVRNLTASGVRGELFEEWVWEHANGVCGRAGGWLGMQEPGQ